MTVLVFDREGKTLFWQELDPWDPESGDALMDFLWDSRESLGGVAHMHPRRGWAVPSLVDTNFFGRAEKWLGRQLLWPIVTVTDVTYVIRNPMYGKHGVSHHWTSADPPDFEIEGVEELRHRSAGQEPRVGTERMVTLEIRLDGKACVLPEPISSHASVETARCRASHAVRDGLANIDAQVFDFGDYQVQLIPAGAGTDDRLILRPRVSMD